jgi:hypothetical protein
MDRLAQYEGDDVWSDTSDSTSETDRTEFNHDLVLVDEFDAL